MAVSRSKTGVKPLPARRQDKYEKRLTSILRSASKVMARDGFEGASVRDVAAQGKIGLSGIYYYFESKDEVLYAIQHRVFSTLVQTLKEQLDAAASPEEQLRAVINNHFRFFVENMDDLKVCVHEIESLSGKYYRDVLEIRKAYFRLVRNIVGKVFRGSRYETNLATLYLFGVLNWVYMWYDSKQNADIEKLSAHFLNVYLNGIRETSEIRD